MRKTLVFVVLSILACLVAGPVVAAEGRTPVYLDGTVIGASGKYIMTRNIVSGGAGIPVIDIVAPYVDLDLNGFTIFGGPGAPCIQISGTPVEVRIYNGTLVDGGSGIFRPLGLGQAQTVIIEDLKIEAMNGTGIELNEVETVVIRRNRIIDAGAVGILLPSPPFKHGSITDNTIKRTRSDGISIDSAAAMEISHNQLEVIGAGVAGNGIVMKGSVGCLVAENLISDAAGEGIILANSNGNKLRNNVVRHAFSHCIHFDVACVDNFILDNVGTDCGFDFGAGHGLWIEGRRNHIEGNTLNGNQDCGLLLDNPSSGNVFGRNMARGNIGAGCPAICGLFPPESCDLGVGNDSNLENMMPGPPPF
ncbi:MAG: right-handed parallel beta-helix repeat-containing protein [Acidobacteriota bacterium]|nr:MAG: right-handed parallel beta-helix repeat-containing protein [Acidobacteriota bacterium]